jgi:AraC-like DNA-binding protein
MDEGIEQAVARVIDAMRDNLGEQFTVDDMARTAMFSKFHFCRTFRQVTGVSPRRFLSALRLQEAKRLLLSTDWTVADISSRVGYSSVGTFSLRFKYSVSVSPTAYRRSGGLAPQDGRHREPTTARPAAIRGEILPPAAGEVAFIFAGLFPDRISQGAPARYTILDTPGTYTLNNVPDGTWYLHAQAFAPSLGDCLDRLPHDKRTSFVGINGPFTIRCDTIMLGTNLQLRPVRTLDPPALVALPDLRSSLPLPVAS